MTIPRCETEAQARAVCKVAGWKLYYPANRIVEMTNRCLKANFSLLGKYPDQQHRIREICKGEK